MGDCTTAQVAIRVVRFHRRLSIKGRQDEHGSGRDRFFHRTKYNLNYTVPNFCPSQSNVSPSSLGMRADLPLDSTFIHRHSHFLISYYNLITIFTDHFCAGQQLLSCYTAASQGQHEGWLTHKQLFVVSHLRKIFKNDQENTAVHTHSDVSCSTFSTPVMPSFSPAKLMAYYSLHNRLAFQVH